MNETGDMLRVSTTVKAKEGKRAIGTFIPAKNADGSENPVISSVKSGKNYLGNAYVVDRWMQTLYKPVKSSSGELIGMIFIGYPLEKITTLRESIINLKVGSTGYAYVISGKGQRKGRYIISKNGERDNEYIYDVKDADGNYVIRKIINQATNSNDGEITFLTYPWKNKGDSLAKNKTVALTYFAPFDWVIGSGTNNDEIYKNAIMVENDMSKLILISAIAAVIIFLLVILVAGFVGNKIAYPIQEASRIITKIANGDVNSALNDLNILEKYYFK